MSDVLWEIDHLTLAGSPNPRLVDVSLRIHHGVTAILGYSGAGKTTLLNLLVGFEKPDRGTIQALPVEGHRLPLYWAPHNDGLWTHLTAIEHLRAVLPAPEQKNDAPSALAMLDAFDLGDKADSYPDQLSQGERSRLAVARTLLANAAVLVMDEPLVHVDPARVGKYWDVIRAWLARTGASLVFSTHEPKRVLAEAQRAVCLEQGRLLYEGPVEDLYYNPPTPELARCMGEGNWLGPDEAGLWLAATAPSAQPRCYRPEQIVLERVAESPIVVRASRFGGSIAEVELWHEGAAVGRRFFHRPAGNHLAAGTRVILKVCLLLILAMLLPGCGRSGSAEPTIRVISQHVWAVPSDGNKVPAPRKMTIGPGGEVLVLDTGARVLVYSPTGEFQRQWRMPDAEAGNPEGVIVLKDGRVAVADTHYYRVVFFNQQGKVVGMLGKFGKGPGEFIYPVTLVQDDQENIYVCEYGGNDRVQKFTRDGKFLLAFGGFGTGPGQFQRPSGLVWHAGKIYVADATNNRVQIFSDAGQFERILDNPAKSLMLRLPYDLCMGPAQTLYVVEWGAGRVTQVGLDGTLIGRFGSAGIGEGQFRTPWGLALDPGTHLIVADTGNRRIVELKL